MAIRKRMQRLKEEGVDLKDLDGVFRKIMESNKKKMTPIQSLFWKEQLKALSAKGPTGIRWSPMMIRLGIHLEAKGSGLYHEMRKLGVVTLPGKTTLRDYTSLLPETLGIRHRNISSLKERCQDTPSGRMFFSLMMDEMTIRENIVFDTKSGNLIGFVNLSQTEEEIERLDQDQDSYTPQAAKKVLVYMAKGLVSKKAAKQVVGIFGVTNANAMQIYDRTWSVIEHLELAGLKVLCVVCDGARTNRSFFKMHQNQEDQNDIISQTPNIFSEDGKRPLYFLSDPPHLLKCLRNNFARDSLWNNGQAISWGAVRSLYYAHRSRTFRKACKLTEAHVELTNFSKMKVYLAAQVMSMTVAGNLREIDEDGQRETIKFIELVDKFFDCLNGHHSYEGRNKLKPALDPYTRDNCESRFHFLKEEFLGHLTDWRRELLQRPGKFSTTQRKNMTITDETYEGIAITVNGFTGAVRYLLEAGVEFVNANVFCQDNLEQYFSQQRASGVLNNHPTLKEVLHNDTRILVKGDVAPVIKTGNTRCHERRVEIDTTPLPRRKKIRV